MGLPLLHFKHNNMEVFFWIILGSLAGLIVTAGMKDRNRLVRLSDVLLGGIGGFIGGYITQHMLASKVMGFYDETVVFVVFGAAILIWLGRKIIHQTALF